MPQLKDCPKFRKLASVISKEEPQSGLVCVQRLKDLDSYIILKGMRKGFKEKHISIDQEINKDDDFFIFEDIKLIKLLLMQIDLIYFLNIQNIKV